MANKTPPTFAEAQDWANKFADSPAGRQAILGKNSVEVREAFQKKFGVLAYLKEDGTEQPLMGKGNRLSPLFAGSSCPWPRKERGTAKASKKAATQAQDSSPELDEVRELLEPLRTLRPLKANKDLVETVEGLLDLLFPSEFAGLDDEELEAKQRELAAELAKRSKGKAGTAG